MRKLWRRTAAAAACAALALNVFAAPVSAGWEAAEGGWKYSQSGSYVKGRWFKTGGVWYHFDQNGRMSTGWVRDSGKWYYCKENGAMATGWVQSGGSWYLCGSDGAMRTGWATVGSKQYFLTSSGEMVTGAVQINGVDYEFDTSGAKTAAVPEGFASAAYTAAGVPTAVVDPVKDGTTVTVTIPEGYTAAQTGALLEKKGVCRKEAFLKAINAYQTTSETFAEFSGNPELYWTFEGCLFPDTYEFYRYDDPANIIRKLLINFDDKIATDELMAQIKAKGSSLLEILTIASIIEEEAAKPEDMAKVSAVIWNRLARPADYPTLGFNPTSEYVSNQILPNAPFGNTAVDPDSYDTYQISGLPAGPIDNPSRNAIQAALNPEPRFHYTFFCTDNSGKFYFARTNAGHQRNLEKVRKVNEELAAQE